MGRPLPDVGAPLPDVIALARAMLHGDTEGIGSIFREYGFTDAKAGGFVGELCGLFLGLLVEKSPDDTDGLLTRLYETSLSD